MSMFYETGCWINAYFQVVYPISLSSHCFACQVDQVAWAGCLGGWLWGTPKPHPPPRWPAQATDQVRRKSHLIGWFIVYS